MATGISYNTDKVIKAHQASVEANRIIQDIQRSLNVKPAAPKVNAANMNQVLTQATAIKK